MAKACNIRLPAEWEKHKSTILCWPHQKDDWPGKFMPIPWVYTEIVKNIIPGENVRIIVQTKKDKIKASSYLKRAHVDLSNISFIITKSDRGWMRDTSPAFIKRNGKVEAVRFTFNGWAKYQNWKNDRNIPSVLSGTLNIEMKDAVYKNRPVVLEGGAIDTNGKGTLITTMECLLDPDVQVRNPGFVRTDYEELFKKYLGITNVIWLNNGIAGDDTHGHVDDLCRFVNRNTVVLCKADESDTDNYTNLRENSEILKDAVLEDGSPVRIVELPMPKPLYFEGLRLPASYANFYVANEAVLVPTFNDVNDRIALDIISELFPDRNVIGIHSVDLVWGLGTLHCLSHEEPE